MAALVLPVEIIEQIGDWLEYASDINPFVCTHRTLYRVVNPMLYRHNVRHGDNSALGWGIMHGFLAIVQQSLESSASIDECDPEIPWRPMAPAVEECREDIIRYLYEQGIEIRHTRGWLPSIPVIRIIASATRTDCCWPLGVGMKLWSASSWTTCRGRTMLIFRP